MYFVHFVHCLKPCTMQHAFTILDYIHDNILMNAFTNYILKWYIHYDIMYLCWNDLKLDKQIVFSQHWTLISNYMYDLS